MLIPIQLIRIIGVTTKSVVTGCLEFFFVGKLGASIQVSFLFGVEISARGDSFLFLGCRISYWHKICQAHW